MTRLFVFFLLFFALACNGDKPRSGQNNADGFNKITLAVRVGMTYEDVEKLLGKPEEISRGAKQLNYLVSGDADSLDVNPSLVRDPKYWGLPKQIQTVGQLIYVTWVFPATKVDTFYTTFSSLKRGQFKTGEIRYLVNGQIIDKQLYDAIGNLVYRDHRGRIITKQEWEALKGSDPSYVREPYPANKTTESLTKSGIQKIRNPQNRKLFRLTQKYCVSFDAASGRVVQSGFQPFQIDELK